MLDNIIEAIPTAALVGDVVLSVGLLGAVVYLLVGPFRGSPDRDGKLLAGGLALLALGGAIATCGFALVLASLAFAVSHDFGSANGSVPVWRAKAPAMVVNGPTRAPLSS